MNIDEKFPKIEKRQSDLEKLLEEIKNKIDIILRDYKIRLTFDEYKKVVQNYIKKYIFDVDIKSLIEITDNITNK